MPSHKAILRHLFDGAVRAADPLEILPDHFPPRPKNGRMLVLGLGKGAARMAEAAEAHYGTIEGLIVTRYGYERPLHHLRLLTAGHPIPDANSKAAAEAMIATIKAFAPNEADLVLTLISGGGSALLSLPVEGVSFAQKQAVNAALLASGAAIDQINAIRQALSLVKGGRLADLVQPARLVNLIISDVPNDDPGLVASGPFSRPKPTTGRDELARRYLDGQPQAIFDALTTYQPPMLDGARIEDHIVASPRQSLSAVERTARAMGFAVTNLGELGGEARSLGFAQAQQAQIIAAQMAPSAQPHLLLSGGECTVTRRGGGVGGPNAEFALALAIGLEAAAGIYALAADTDGVDGAAEIAGAFVTPDTIARACGDAMRAALDDNDAHSFFAAIDDQLITGPTLTNVNDLRMILIWPTGKPVH